jgi:hypothetical protein
MQSVDAISLHTHSLCLFAGQLHPSLNPWAVSLIEQQLSVWQKRRNNSLDICTLFRWQSLYLMV